MGIKGIVQIWIRYIKKCSKYWNKRIKEAIKRHWKVKNLIVNTSNKNRKNQNFLPKILNTKELYNNIT